MEQIRQRIEYIDIAKGFCILLVVFAHVHPATTDYDIGVFFDSFRMPLYFFLSGLFFKTYSGIDEFSLKKINNLIIPLLFFYAFAYIYDAATWGIRAIQGLDTVFYERHSWWPFWEIIRNGTSYHNSPLWFLVSLFEVNLLYYTIYRYTHRLWRDVSVIVIATAGWLLAKDDIQLPYFIGTSLVALPFFHIGCRLREAKILEYSSRDRYAYTALVPAIISVWFLAEPIRLHELLLPPSFITFYLCGTLGTLIILYISKAIAHLPCISFFGRYSLIVFGTHWSIYHTIINIVDIFIPVEEIAYLITFVLTITIEIPIIYLLRQYAPRFTAQAEFFSTARFHSTKEK